MQPNTQWQISSQQSLTLFLGGEISLDKQKICWALAKKLNAFTHVREVVIGMNTLTAYADTTCATEFLTLHERLNEFSAKFVQTDESRAEIFGKHVDIPVRYGGEFGEDLASAAEMLGMSVNELVEAHTAPTYTVYFIGFQAGFPYLGGLPKELHLPRHAKPRLSVPAGSVGIGGAQTGIYPFSSPGGWQLLGQTDLALFDKLKNPPTTLQAGDTLRFVATQIIA
ncbi:hypothetical protein B0181_09715 [Moraxella caviae]|uniref:Sporulation inhibitor kipI n=1 Tax=Moraxella caviae TaxID=34060 RepID=A0A1S9ZW63_9GAMM|nr:5-oxoprolinase subunit PxpB [Moraxella caviae]OOR87724.1 hypothetical protein B0181_09715 [Moraxella caviae]STZ10134.1 Sporulation inhibitor kipI [Moraxella caviae]VEW11096.1 Sporulation inhibitor kipI [Moraxella caviae]